MDIKFFVNSPVPSNTYILVVDKHCIIIDPGSKSPRLYEQFIDSEVLTVDCIILTHEHFDHIWSADYLRTKYHASIICSERCAERMSVPQNYFNRLYYNDSSYYYITNADMKINGDECIEWMEKKIYIWQTPGHTLSSICIGVDNILFSGDTFIKGAKPFIKKRHEGSIMDFKCTAERMFSLLPLNTIVYAGHNEIFRLNEIKEDVVNFINM